MDLPARSSLITIGAFAHLGGVSIKALRLYARRGLLRPAHVSPDSGYRWYSTGQLTRLHRILLLKSLDLPLAEIGCQLSQPDETALSTIRDRLRARIQETQRQLSWVEAALSGAAPGSNGVRTASVVIKRAPRIRVRSMRHRIDSYQQADAMLHSLETGLPAASRLVSGAIWHDCGQRTKVIDCEVFWVLSESLRARATKELAPATVASVLHQGAESTIGVAYEQARRWIVDNRYTIVGPNRELYLGPVGPEHAGTLTEIQFPVERSKN